MPHPRQPSKLKYIQTSLLVCLVILACCGVALSAYLFGQAKENSKTAPAFSGLSTVLNPEGLEHRYVNHDLSSGIYQLPKDFLWVFG